jgi:flagellar export protein FliJ
MSSAGIRSLQAVLDWERRRRDQAQSALQQAERQMAQAMAQGRMLTDYRQQTAQRWAAPLQRATTPQAMHTARGFLGRLDGALEQHSQIETVARQRAEQCRRELLAAETRLAMVDKLMQRRRVEHQRRLDRREQTEMDALAQRRPQDDHAHETTAEDEDRPPLAGDEAAAATLLVAQHPTTPRPRAPTHPEPSPERAAC